MILLVIAAMELVNVLGLLHAASCNEAAWVAADRSKIYWVFGLVTGLLLPPYGVLVTIVYATAIAPRLRRSPASPQQFLKK